jgi:replicative DNA helicase
MDKSLNNELQGVETGFKQLNELSGGWQKGDLIIVAGRPGMGKTAFTLTLARNAAVMANQTAVFFSLEMPTNQLMMRLISSESDVEQEKIRRGTINQAELAQVTSKMDKLNKVNLFFDDTPGLSVMDFRKKVRKIKRDHGLGLIVIDYLQLMTVNMVEGNGKIISNREQQIAFISRSLKSIAKELEVPIIALAQLSRQAENRGTSTKPSKPMLSDLRESGSIEQDADMVIFLYREAYYDKEARDADGNSLEEVATISVAKNRNGRTDSFNARFIGKYVKYCDWDDQGLSSNTMRYADIKNKQADDFGDTPTMTVPSKMNHIDREEFFKDDVPPAGGVDDFDDLD